MYSQAQTVFSTFLEGGGLVGVAKGTDLHGEKSNRDKRNAL